MKLSSRFGSPFVRQRRRSAPINLRRILNHAELEFYTDLSCDVQTARARQYVVEDVMNAPLPGPEARNAQDNSLNAPPFQTAWQSAFFELPLAFAAEALRFTARRLEAQGDFFAGLETCHTVPEVMDAQSRFVRSAVGDYGSQTSKIINDIRDTVSKAA
jgi:hypothetical protein